MQYPSGVIKSLWGRGKERVCLCYSKYTGVSSFELWKFFYNTTELFIHRQNMNSTQLNGSSPELSPNLCIFLSSRIIQHNWKSVEICMILCVKSFSSTLGTFVSFFSNLFLRNIMVHPPLTLSLDFFPAISPGAQHGLLKCFLTIYPYTRPFEAQRRRLSQ